MTKPPYGPTPTDLAVEPAPIDLAHYVRLLWRRRVVLVGVALAAAVAAVVLGLMQDRVYEASVSLFVNHPKLANAPVDVAPADFRPIVANRASAEKVIAQLGLTKNGRPLTETEFLRDVLRIEEVRGSSVIILHVRWGDPDLAAQAANLLGQEAVALARRVSQDEAVRASEGIKAQLDDARRRLQESRAALNNFRREAQLELLRKDVDAILVERAGLLRLLVDIATERARLDRAERDLEAVPRVNTFRRTIDSEPALAEAARHASPDTSLLALEMQVEQANPVHQALEQTAAASRSRLAGLERQRKELIERRRLDASQQAALNRLYEAEARLAQLELEQRLAENVFADLSTRFEVSRIDVASRSAELLVVDAARVPGGPLPRGVGRNGVLAFALSIGVGVVLVVLADSLARLLRGG